MKRSTLVTLLTVFLLIPLTLYFGTKLPGRSYYLTGTALILEMLLPFFMAFEGRKVLARELVVTAILCAISVVARVAIPIPQFKPMFAVIMLSGIALGPQTGFMVGAISAFVSNFFVGQGAYTPWQMFAYGAGGLAAGLFFGRKNADRSPWSLCFFGFFATLLWVGPLLDTCTVFLALPSISLQTVWPIYLSGFPMNLLQALCTALTMLLLGRSFLAKMDRLKHKYGIIGT